jgi:hypothetical protein
MFAIDCKKSYLVSKYFLLWFCRAIKLFKHTQKCNADNKFEGEGPPPLAEACQQYKNINSEISMVNSLLGVM